MKKKLLLIGISILFVLWVKAQDLVISFDFNHLSIAQTITDKERDRINEDSFSEKIILRITNIPSSIVYKLNPGLLSGTRNSSQIDFDITKDFLGNIKNKRETANYKLTNSADKNVSTLKINWNKIENIEAGETDEEIIKKSIENKNKLITSFTSNSTFTEPYDVKKDRIDLYFNENGKLMNNLPVNVDQNDKFYMHILCEENEEQNYRVNTIEGEYAPVDLTIRPYEKITSGDATGSSKLKVKKYTSKILEAGPYTSEHFKFQIAYDSISSTSNGPSYSLKINKLYHVGIGMSLISTNLTNPNFETYYNGTDSTIIDISPGSRTMITFNVIWYWSILHQNYKGNIITSGRDVLKDEPTFSFKRLYPTIGVSFDNKLRENFFGGFVYEFARGGSFIVGVHYGKVNKLADESFKLGVTKFIGTDSDIRTKQFYSTDFFFGVTLDTRIFNILFGSNK
jgi:hypothetical protein